MGVPQPSHSLRRRPALAPLRAVRAYLRDDWVRGGVRIRRERPENLFQPYGVAVMDRYPRCFAFAVFRDDALSALPLRCDQLLRFVDFDPTSEPKPLYDRDDRLIPAAPITAETAWRKRG